VASALPAPGEGGNTVTLDRSSSLAVMLPGCRVAALRCHLRFPQEVGLLMEIRSLQGSVFTLRWFGIPP
jgi:hypothetical protein